mgnify:FL=1
MRPGSTEAKAGSGVQGGCPSPASRTFVVRDGQPIRVKPHRMVEIKTGDILAKISGGGGGVGFPFERPPELVALDVKNEMVSVEAARKVYGVAVDPVTFAIDAPETRRLRSASPQSWDVVIDEQQLIVELAPHKA